jgi:hypothetical protein
MGLAVNASPISMLFSASKSFGGQNLAGMLGQLRQLDMQPIKIDPGSSSNSAAMPPSRCRTLPTAKNPASASFRRL